jgi:hypothetical protein
VIGNEIDPYQDPVSCEQAMRVLDARDWEDAMKEKDSIFSEKAGRLDDLSLAQLLYLDTTRRFQSGLELRGRPDSIARTKHNQKFLCSRIKKGSIQKRWKWGRGRASVLRPQL